MHNAIFLCNNKGGIPRAFSEEQLDDAIIINHDELLDGNLQNAHVEYVFSTWGMPSLSEEEIKHYLPNLKAVFYAAGTVQGFARPFLNQGVKIFSAWAGNAIPVAEFSAAQIVLAGKGYFQLHSRYKQNYAESIQYAERFGGNYGAKVGILGAGMIGQKVINLLSPYNLNIKVFDPFFSHKKADELGVEKTSLEEIFASCQTISNHLANNENTKNIIDYRLLSTMKDNVTFINTGRGAQIVMEDLIRVMKEKPSRTALLDVTDPTEPLPSNSKIWSMPNIFITPHRAGSVNDEIKRMGEFMFDEYRKFINDEQTQYEVTLEMLETMA